MRKKRESTYQKIVLANLSSDSQRKIRTKLSNNKVNPEKAKRIKEDKQRRIDEWREWWS